MKIRYAQRHAALALGALTLLGGSLAAMPARAQDAGVASDKPITLNLQNVPIQTALKLLFTSEPLSIQVHPDDTYARPMGMPNGKSEAWYILPTSA